MLVEQRSLNYSLALHFAAVILILFGLPVLLPSKPEPIPMVISLDILPISDVSNVKPADKPIQKEQKAPTPKTPKPVEPSVTEKPKEVTPPAEKAKPTPAPPTEKHFDPTEGAKPEPAPKEEPTPVPSKDKAKDKPKEKPDEDFAALLNKLKQENQTAPAKEAKDKTNTAENKTKSDAPYDASKPMSISERDAIRSQFVPCWTPPMGAKDASTLAVRVKVELSEDGTVKSAALSPDQQGRYSSDPFFRAAADSAVRAVHKCSPLKNLPADKYGTWRSMEINFDPRDM